MSSRKWPFALYLFFVVACILFVAELTSLQVNRSEGAELPFFFGEGRSVESFRGRRFMALDPHLGYAYSDGEALVEEIGKAKGTKHKALGLGTDVRWTGRLNGGALLHEERLVHLCVFRDGAEGNGGGSRMGRMVRASRRRG